MELVKIKDKSFEIFIPAAEIQSAVEKVANGINNDFRDKNPLFLAVLNGAFIFAADLFKLIEIECEISFVKLASYHGTKSSGKIRELIGLDGKVSGRTLIIIEDIVDSGLSMEYLLKELISYKPASVSIASLLVKPEALVKKIDILYTGIEIPNDFIVGYGLDYEGFGRNLPDIYRIAN